MMGKTRRPNCITTIAEEYGRTTVTPEDVSRALLRGEKFEHVRLDILEVLANITKFSLEDPSLCAFTAWEGSRSKINDPDKD